MNDFFLACYEANKDIEEHIHWGLSQNDTLKSTLGAGGDISSGIDIEAENIFIKHLLPFGRIESEECGALGDGDNTIVIDPIDGSSNILSGFPYYGTSVAFINSDGDTMMATICNLSTKEIFVKEAGKKPLKGTLFGDKFIEYDAPPLPEIGIFERAYLHLDIVDKLIENDMKFRAPGAVALSLVYARLSRYFLYLGKRRLYDFAAGLLFCEDMEVDVNDEYAIVTKDKRVLETIKSIVVESRG